MEGVPPHMLFHQGFYFGLQVSGGTLIGLFTRITAVEAQIIAHSSWWPSSISEGWTERTRGPFEHVKDTITGIRPLHLA